MQTYDLILSRLQNQAAGRFNCKVENLPPEPRLFINWMASELEVLHRELAYSNNAVEISLRRRLQPDTNTRPLPEHALAYAQPKKDKYTLKSDEDVFYLPRLGSDEPRRLFYTPLLPVQLVKAQVKYLINHNTLTEITAPFYKSHQLTAAADKVLHPGVLWVGVEAESLPADGHALCFYIQMEHTEEKRFRSLLRLLPLIQWKNGDRILSTDIGLRYDRDVTEQYNFEHLNEEYLFLYQLEKDVLEYYDAQFISVPIEGLQKTVPPLLEFFPQEKQSEELFWFQLSFPSGFTTADIQQTSLQLNCFPILNRRLDKTRDFTPGTPRSTEVRNLSNAGQGRAALSEQGDLFLGIQRVYTHKYDYRPVAFEHFRQANRGSYALQHGGVEEGDVRDLYGRLLELSRLLREQVANLVLIDQHSLNMALQNIESGTEMLQNALHQIPEKNADLGYYLHIKILDPQDFIYVRFWLTQGNTAQNVGRPGDKLSAERANVLKEDVVWWLGKRRNFEGNS